MTKPLASRPQKGRRRCRRLAKPALLASALLVLVASTGVQGHPGGAQVPGGNASTSARFEDRRATHPDRAIAEMQPVATAQAGRTVCPSNNIADFFRAFAENPEIQRIHTAAIVETAFVDWSAQPEPIESTEPMPREKLHFPLVPNRAAQRQGGLRYRELAGDGHRATVVLEVPDTDMQLRYTFRRDACWTLIKIVDPAFGKGFPGEASPAKTIGLPDAGAPRRK